MEERQLLLPVGGVVERIDVQRQSCRRPVERRDELIDQEILQPEEGSDIDGVLETRQRGLTGQLGIVHRAVAEKLEDRIAAQHVVIVLIGVAGQNSIDAHARHLQERVIDVAGGAAITECFGELPRQPDVIIELTKGQQPSIAGNLRRRWLDHHGLGCEKIKADSKSRLRIHPRPPCVVAGVVSLTP